MHVRACTQQRHTPSTLILIQKTVAPRRDLASRLHVLDLAEKELALHARAIGHDLTQLLGVHAPQVDACDLRTQRKSLNEIQMSTNRAVTVQSAQDYADDATKKLVKK